MSVEADNLLGIRPDRTLNGEQARTESSMVHPNLRDECGNGGSGEVSGVDPSLD